jgi:hypothetical protein
MIGDVKHKKGSKAVAYEGKNSKGRSHKVNLPAAGDGGGDNEQVPKAKRLDKHTARPGTGTHDKQNPKAQRSRKIEEWCHGKGHYK